ncbi:ATP-dependent DNA helicase, partial [Pseudomonas aeruginosa]
LAFKNAVAARNDLLGVQPQALYRALQEFYVAIRQVGRLAELVGEHSLFDIDKRQGRNCRSLARLCLLNVVPAAFLSERFAAIRSTV